MEQSLRHHFRIGNCVDRSSFGFSHSAWVDLIHKNLQRQRQAQALFSVGLAQLPKSPQPAWGNPSFVWRDLTARPMAFAYWAAFSPVLLR